MSAARDQMSYPSYARCMTWHIQMPPLLLASHSCGSAAGDQTSRSTSAVRKSWHVQMPSLLIGKPALMTTPTGVKIVAAAHRAAAAEVAEKRTAAAAAASRAAPGKGKPVAATKEGPANPAKQGGSSQLTLQQKGPVGVAAAQKESLHGARAAHVPAEAGVNALACSADVDVPQGATEGGSTAAAAGATAAYQQQLMAQPLTAQGKREGLRDATNQQHHAQPAGLCHAPVWCHCPALLFCQPPRLSCQGPCSI